MPSNHLILCHPLLLLPSIFPSIRVFSDESVVRIRWPKYGSFSFSISPSNEYSGLISFRMDWLDLLAVQGTLTLYASQLKRHRCIEQSFGLCGRGRKRESRHVINQSFQWLAHILLFRKAFILLVVHRDQWIIQIMQRQQPWLLLRPGFLSAYLVVYTSLRWFTSSSGQKAN